MSGTALVTGVSGFAGRQVARLLVDADWTVVGTVGRRRSGVAGVEEHQVDIADESALRAVVERSAPTVIFHLAAIVDTVTTPDVVELHRVNTLGTVALLEALRASEGPTRMLYASSAFAYGLTAPDVQPVGEDEPLRPLTPYGASKAAGEMIALQFGRETGAEVVVTRAFQHTGDGHVGAYALADWAHQLASIEAGPGSGTIRCGNIDVERDYLDVVDVAGAYLAVAERGQPGEVYNVGSGTSVSMRSLLEGLVAAFDVDVRIEVDESRLRKVDQPRFYADIAKLRADTGWKPARSPDETLRSLAEFWRDRVRAG